MDIHFDNLGFLWTSMLISLDFYGYPCIDLLRIHDPGKPTRAGPVTASVAAPWPDARGVQFTAIACTYV